MNDLNKSGLDKLKGIKANYFQDIPPGYFDQLPEVIMEKALQNPTPVSRRLSSRYIFGIAAALLLLLGLTFVLVNLNRTENIELQLTENQMPATFTTDSAENPETTTETPEALPVISLKEEEPATEEDPLKELEEIPLEALLDYLDEVDEFGF